MPRRVFPIDDWAPVQEARYPDSASVAHTDMAGNGEGTSRSSESRMRSLSLSLSWRTRPKSIVIDDLALRTNELSLEPSRSNGSSQGHGQRRPSGLGLDNIAEHAGGEKGDMGGGKGKNAFKGVFRRASVSLKGMMPRRTSLATDTADETQFRRRHVSSSHAASHSHSQSLFSSPFEQATPARPTTAHSTWQRLRHAASFRRNRMPGSGLETIESPRELDFHVPTLPLPGSGTEPPVIPPNTGSAARAAAAAFHSEANKPWLNPDEWQNDRESGIGIAVSVMETDGVENVEVDGRTSSEVVADAETDKTGIDFVQRLPAELVLSIFAHLDAANLVSASRVSRSWNGVVSSQHIWRDSFMREKTATYAMSGPLRPGCGLGVPNVRPGTDWKQVYRIKKELESRWKSGQARPVYLNGHTDSIYCLQFDESKIITGSRDKTIRIWDMKTLACRLVIGPPEIIHDSTILHDDEGRPTHFAMTERAARVAASMPAAVAFPTHHKASILCLQYDDQILVTGSSDASCIVYSVRGGYRPIRRLVHHSAAVLDLCFDSKHIVTCSKDASICVWDRATGALVRQLRGHAGPVNAVQMRGNTVVSCSGDYKVKLWDIERGVATREFAGHTKGLACSQFSEDGRYVASAGNDRVIRVWDARTGECVREIRAHENLVRSLHIDSATGRLVSASYDTDIKVFDMATGRQLLDFPGWHQSWVLSAKCDYRRIISTGQDPKILIMDFGAGVAGIDAIESIDPTRPSVFMGAAGPGARRAPLSEAEFPQNSGAREEVVRRAGVVGYI